MHTLFQLAQGTTGAGIYHLQLAFTVPAPVAQRGAKTQGMQKLCFRRCRVFAKTNAPDSRQTTPPYFTATRMNSDQRISEMIPRMFASFGATPVTELKLTRVEYSGLVPMSP